MTDFDLIPAAAATGTLRSFSSQRVFDSLYDMVLLGQFNVLDFLLRDIILRKAPGRLVGNQAVGLAIRESVEVTWEADAALYQEGRVINQAVGGCYIGRLL